MIPLDESYRHAEELTRAEARNFFYAFRFLPAHRRRSICAVYAFSRRCDDTVDAVEEADVPEAVARANLDYLSSFLGDAPPTDPLVPALQDTLARFSIPRDPLDQLIEGMEMDLVKKRYRTFEELYEYCYRAASVVGLVCIEIFGHEGGNASELAVHLGIAMQLTNILRDVKEDRVRGRVYLPAEDLERFEYTEDDLAAGTVNDRFRSLMAFEVERARGFFTASEPLYDLILPESRYCPVLLMRFYSKILQTIENLGYDVLHHRPRLSWHEKIRLAAALWLEVRAARLGFHSPIQKEVT